MSSGRSRISIRRNLSSVWAEGSVILPAQDENAALILMEMFVLFISFVSFDLMST